MEDEELSQSEFTYVEVVDSLIDDIDYATVEALFKTDNKLTNASFMYELLTDYDEEQDTIDLSFDSKVNELFKVHLGNRQGWSQYP